ncbi:MAG: hypothetical protein JST60_15835 [Chloroflexi bacterium SZAS-1]|jgi:RNase P subunit RPR2|nr:hypothetical protein [Chloroflexi bacterium SZAS-1]HNP85298.1 hypothetical protein [Kouleothrix sp.]
MSYNDQQRQQIASWIAQKVPRLTREGCPLCGSTTGGYGVERVTVPSLEVPLLAVACRNCGHVMLFNEQSVLSVGK